MSYNPEDVLPALQAEEVILKKVQKQIESALSALKTEENILVETAERLTQEETFAGRKQQSMSKRHA
jgi:hypothetical protein